MFPILTPTAKLFIAIIGLITLTMSALIASVQNSIQRLLAYSTISQFGYMMLAMGIGSWVGGLFHLIAHALFKSLLFLGAGSVIRAAGREQDIARFGGLWRKLPITTFTFGLAVLAMAGTPYLAGSLGKTMILTQAAAVALLARGDGRSPAYAPFFILPAAVSILTAFYMARCWMLTFWGKSRDQALCDGAREYPIMWAPLCALAFIIIVGGLYFSVSVQPLLESSIKETQAVCHDIQLRDGFFQSRPDFAGFARVWPGPPTADPDDRLSSMVAAGSELQHRWLQYGTLIGIALAALVYSRGYSLTRWFMQIPPIRWSHRWLAAGMYFDELYLALVVGLVWFIARLCAWFDRKILERSLDRIGRLVRRAAPAVAPGEREAGRDAVAGGIATGGPAGASAGVITPRAGQLNVYITLLMVATLLIFTAVALLEWN